MAIWDWAAKPTYESERIRIDRRLSPLVLYDLKLPRRLEDHEVALMLGLADYHFARGLPLVGLIRHERGAGVISARHRKTFADWFDEQREATERADAALVIVVPEAIVRAVIRVVYRFRSPPIRTVTAPDIRGAIEAVRGELARMGQAITPQIDAFLDRLVA